MSTIAVALLFTLTGYLTVSAVAKTIQAQVATAALTDLGLTHTFAHFAVRMTVLTELTAASTFALWPHALSAQCFCIGLFGVFALFGGFALWRGGAIECGCMGGLRHSKLGWPQLAQFAAVIAMVAIIGRFAPRWGVRTGLSVLLAVEVAAAAVLLLYLARTWWQIRVARVSLAHTREVARRLGSKTLPVPTDGGGVQWSG